MLNKSEFATIRKELDTHSRAKIEVMKQSRDIVKTSKQLIYSIHRQDLKTSSTILKKIKAERKKLDKSADSPKLKYYHPYLNGLQEYVEAVGYYHVMTENRIPTKAEMGVDAETYLMGLSDLTGELMRKGVDDMINERYDHAILMKDVVAEIYGLVLSLDLDGGEARRKSDQVKWNLAKLEDKVYDAKIRDKI